MSMVDSRRSETQISGSQLPARTDTRKASRKGRVLARGRVWKAEAEMCSGEQTGAWAFGTVVARTLRIGCVYA